MLGLIRNTWFGTPFTATLLDRFYADPDIGEIAATVNS